MDLFSFSQFLSFFFLFLGYRPSEGIVLPQTLWMATIGSNRSIHPCLPTFLSRSLPLNCRCCPPPLPPLLSMPPHEALFRPRARAMSWLTCSIATTLSSTCGGPDSDADESETEPRLHREWSGAGPREESSPCGRSREDSANGCAENWPPSDLLQFQDSSYGCLRLLNGCIQIRFSIKFSSDSIFVWEKNIKYPTISLSTKKKLVKASQTYL